MSQNAVVGSSRSGGEPEGFLRGSAPQKSLTKADAAYAEIRARILSCDLPPGSVIDQELLAGWLGSSTTPVREALRRLEAEQLVSLRAHSEVRVAPVSLNEFREFHTIRVGLEPIAAAEAATRMSDDEIEALRTRFLTNAPPADATVSHELDRSRSFHRAIYTAAENTTMTQILDSIWDRAGRYRVIWARAGSVPACQTPEHEQIVAALEKRDQELVSSLLRSDLDATFQRILPISEEALKPYT